MDNSIRTKPRGYPPIPLPEAPDAQGNELVKVWEAPLVIPTYEPLPPDKNPMFLERRVYQGSSGRVYPLPFYNRISDTPTPRAWQAIHLENEFVRIMLLPEIGGRVHLLRDKTNGYDAVYRQDVIKPALVGLAGPWVSGGIEFNWPQHHRPATFMPVATHVERSDDGDVTVWMSDHDPVSRMKGMHGIRLRPGSSAVELRVRLFNRTPYPQTFLWWANVATRVHELYQSFFPPDVRFVADHARRATSTFPLARGQYYGVDYANRGVEGVPASERPPSPPCYVQQSERYAAADLSWYANIPVPTSYMITGTRHDFFGGYDHRERAGLVHVASRHIAPGKKQWTWGNHAFGHAWDRNLTEPDENGEYRPYIELMAGVFTDNQPDFSFLAPGETRTFTQTWYPIRAIGPAHAANERVALSLRLKPAAASVGVYVTRNLPNATVTLLRSGKVVAKLTRDLGPDKPLVETLPLPQAKKHLPLRVVVADASGETLLTYEPSDTAAGDETAPCPATEPPPPRDIRAADELYLTGLHLAQYRHATRDPEAYWSEAIRRDPLDARSNTAMGWRHLHRGMLEEAAAHFSRAIERLTVRNPNPADGDAHYGLGLTLRLLDRDDEACDAFHKATWLHAWQAPAYLALGEIEATRQRWDMALEHLDRSLRVNADDLTARALKAVVLRRLARREEADALLHATHRLDPLDARALHLLGTPIPGDRQTHLDVALDLARAGLVDDAVKVLDKADDLPVPVGDGAPPLVCLHRAFLHDRAGRPERAGEQLRAARDASPDYCFPARLEDLRVLTWAVTQDPDHATARQLLGNWLYDRRRYGDAIVQWQAAVRVEPGLAVGWRNLGLAYHNVLGKPARAKAAYGRAVNADPRDGRLLYERDQLWKRTGVPPARRLRALEQARPLVDERDDLTIEYAALLNQVRRPGAAAELLAGRRFQPWEGGEGQALTQHTRAHLALGRHALQHNDVAAAKRAFEHALSAPENLGEARHLLANVSDVHYWLGTACRTCGDEPAAERHFALAADFKGDFVEMSVRAFGEMTYYSALSARALGREAQADTLLRGLLTYARTLRGLQATIDYFATSLPTLLLFEDDLTARQETLSLFLEAQARLGLGQKARGRSLLATVLSRDPNHAHAADLLDVAGPGEVRGHVERQNPVRTSQPRNGRRG